MQDYQQLENQPVVKQPSGVRHENFGWGVFLLLVGLGLLAERMGWSPANAGWLLPVVLIAWGAAKIYGAFARQA
jgi:hypothetical protein